METKLHEFWRRDIHLYAVECDGKYFTWCYTDKPFAEQMVAKLNGSDVNNVNWKDDLEDLYVSRRTKFEGE